jgi:F-type H+-transporting ATPase subunit b
MSDALKDPMVFYAIAFFIFLALAVRFGRKPALGWIDGEIAKIRVELDQARQLRAEAEATLVECQAKQARAEADAQEILTSARNQAEQLRRKAEADLAAYLKRQEQLASERIRLAETEAVATVRAAAIDEAMAIARKTLAENMPEADSARLISQAVADIPALKDAKAKAA